MSVRVVAYMLPGCSCLVRSPEARGVWVRVHRCVIARPCPHCGVQPGIPCRGSYQPATVLHHWTRQHTNRRHERERTQDCALRHPTSPLVAAYTLCLCRITKAGRGRYKLKPQDPNCPLCGEP